VKLYPREDLLSERFLGLEGGGGNDKDDERCSARHKLVDGYPASARDEEGFILEGHIGDVLIGSRPRNRFQSGEDRRVRIVVEAQDGRPADVGAVHALSYAVTEVE
jgi:hypothetical protein